MSNLDDGGRQRLAYELSLRALGQQENTLNDLRTRTGTLLAASSLASSFLGAQAVDRGGVTWLTALALMAFGGSVIASLFILLPKSQLTFALRGSVLYRVATFALLLEVVLWSVELALG